MTGFGGVKAQAPRGIATPIRVYQPPIHHPGHGNHGRGNSGAGYPASGRPNMGNPDRGGLSRGGPGMGNPGFGNSGQGGSGFGDRGSNNRGFGNPISSHQGQQRNPSGPQGNHVGGAGSFHAPVVGDGLTIAGSYHDGPWSLVFRVGGVAGYNYNHHNKDCFVLPVYSGACGAYPYWPVGSYYDGYGVAFGYGSYYSDYGYERPVIGEPAPPPAPPEAAAPMTAQEHAASLLRYGDARAAISAYQAILKQQPRDAESMRALGLALIDNGQTGDGIAVMGMAYRDDSTLAAYPVPREMFGKHSRLRGNLNRVSTYANREKSASAWLTLAALMQAEGRYGQALAMVDRAKAAGLEEQIVQEMTAALAPLDSQVR